MRVLSPPSRPWQWRHPSRTTSSISVRSRRSSSRPCAWATWCCLPIWYEPFVAAQSVVARHTPTLNQAAVATFIAEGHFERHLARMRRVYSSRHDALLDALDQHLPGIAVRDTSMTSAGLHVLTRFDTDLSEQEISRRAAAVGVTLEGAGRCFVTPPERPHFAIGYSSMPEEQIHRGIERLAPIFRQWLLAA